MWFLLLLALADGPRTFHPVPLAKLPQTIWTHVHVCGTVALVKHEADGDVHIRIEEGAAFAVVEIVPYHPLPPPTKGDHICADGISREDRDHHWYEIHPAERITVSR